MKAYVKPELFYERYELSKHIADCAFELNNSTDVKECTAKVDPEKDTYLPTDQTVFLTKEYCGVELQYYCYFDGADAAKVFMS